MAAAQSGKSKFWVTLTLVLVVALGGAVGTAWFLLGNPPVNAAPHAAGASGARPVFYNLEPFTVNLKSGAYGDQLLYVGITLEVGNMATRQYLQEHLPQVRNRLLMVLSGQEAGTLISRKGKQQLATLIRQALNEPLAGKPAGMQVDSVLFTQFIVQ